MTTQEKISIMQAYVDGKTIEYKYRGCNVWDEFNKYTMPSPLWLWQEFDYRVKLEPKQPIDEEKLDKLAYEYIIDSTHQEDEEEIYISLKDKDVIKGFKVGYNQGATAQDRIARAEQREIDIEKACEWIEDRFGESYLEYFRNAMES